MRKKWFKAVLMTVAVCCFTACDETSGDNGKTDDNSASPSTTGAYIINTGDWNANNGSIMWYDKTENTVSPDIYMTENDKGIGDVQDLCVYGSKIYVTSSTSSKLVILNRQGKELKSIPLTNESGQPTSPRYITSAEGHVFFTSYDGTVSRIDTTSMEIDMKVNVGNYPEGLTYANGKLYICLSDYNMDGTGKYIAVVDVANFTKIKDIEVLLNPYNQIITGTDNKVYFVSNGNYAGADWLEEKDYIYQTLQCIDPVSDEVTSLCNATYITNFGNKMYILYSEYYLPESKRAFVYDLNTKEESDFIDINTLPNPQFIVADPSTGYLYIGNTYYDGSYSDIYVYNGEGEKINELEAGYYTTNLRFVND